MTRLHTDLPKLKFFKLHPDAPTPKRGTKESACFDVSAFWPSLPYGQYTTLTKYDEKCVKTLWTVHDVVGIHPGERFLIPTGLIFDIPLGYSVRLHPRSGLSLKLGLVLANAEAVIDADYIEETFILATNISHIPISIKNGERIAQGELVRNLEYDMEETTERPQQKTDRNGGLGSTGV
jgi:dUTP pyrophosphatase